MKKIIPFFTIIAMVPHLALFGQSAESIAENAGPPVQNQNQAASTETSGQPANNRNTVRAVVQQNQQPTAGVAVGGYGGVGVWSAAPGYAYRLNNAFSRFPGSGENPLLIRSSDVNPKDEANLREDLAVMEHILDKALDDLPGGQAHARTAMGIDVFVAPNSSAMHTMYIEGYGVLFVLNVGFPVLATASAAQEEKPSGDSAWEEARQELYGQSVETQTLTVPGEEFSEEKVNRLKETLLRALKNATNIRGLGGNITVCVLGGANLVPSSTTRIWKVDGANNGAAPQVLTGEAAQVHGTVLTITVTKANVDAYARGELKLDDFQKRAKISAYTASASGAGAPGFARFGGGFGGGGARLAKPSKP
jgi:hypothetical protein